MIRQLSAVIGTGLAAGGAVYAGFALGAVVKGLLRANPGALREGRQKSAQVPVSVLKPLCGDEPRLYENLRSFCAQSHSAFQLLFGVRDPGDPAIAVVRRLQGEFPALDIQMVIDPRVHGANPKVSNLINLLPKARYERLVLADSDIGVGPDYLCRVTAPLADAGVGVVTCLYRGVPCAGFWSGLGAQLIDEWFVPSVQVAHAFGSTRFSFGSTLALRRDALDAAGGLAALKDLLADDFWLGEFTRRRGLRTVLSDVWVTTDVADGSLSALWTHELRWMRTIRAAAPVGFALAFITFTIPVLAAGLALARSESCLVIAGVGCAARIALHFLLRRRRNQPSPAGDVVRVPLRDILLLAEWAAALAGSRVRWRQHILDASTRPRPVYEA